jgi:SAM-dependent methyltransferase
LAAGGDHESTIAITNQKPYITDRNSPVALSDLFARRRKDEQDTDGPVQPTRALDRFLAGLSGRPQPVILDLGPVVGSNVTFFREEVGCKICLEDLPKDIDRHVTEGKAEQLATFFDTRFPYESDTIDGILCWDIFDFLDRTSAERLAKQLKRVLRPDGLLLAFFSTADPRSTPRATYTKHVVVDRTHIQYRTYAAARGKERPLLNRDIQRLLEPLRITENVLLKNNLREVLFRKPGAAQTAAAPPAAR